MFRDHEATRVTNNTVDNSGTEQMNSEIERGRLSSPSDQFLTSTDSEFMYFCFGLPSRDRASCCSHPPDSRNPYAPPLFSDHYHSTHSGLVQRLFNDCSNQEIKDNVGLYFVSTASASVIANELIMQLLNIPSWSFSNSVVQKSFFMVGVVALCAAAFILSTCEWYRRKNTEPQVQVPE
jgi:hypothetical protein